MGQFESDESAGASVSRNTSRLLLMRTLTPNTGAESLSQPASEVRYGLVARISRSHREGPGSIPGVGIFLCFFLSRA